jgi:hypothetical protein
MTSLSTNTTVDDRTTGRGRGTALQVFETLLKIVDMVLYVCHILADVEEGCVTRLAIR